MGHELVRQSVTLLPHVHVVAQLLHCSFENVGQPCAVLREVVGYVGYRAIVVVDRRDVKVGVPVNYPLSVVVVDEYLVYIAPEENLAPLPRLLNNCHLIFHICDGFLPPSRGEFKHFVNSLPNIFLVFFWALHLGVSYFADPGLLLLLRPGFVLVS